MAERNIVGSLFGMTPEMYQQGVARRSSAENLTAAQLTPGQLAGYYAMEAGTGLGRATQGLLGVEDPELNLIRQTNALVQQIGVDTPEKLKTLAGELQKLPGGAALAAQAVDQANKMLVSAATVKQKSRENAPTPQTQAEAAKLVSLQAKYPDTLEGKAQAADDFAEWKSGFKQKEAAAGVAKTAGNISGTIRDYQLTVKPYTDTIDASETVVNLLNEAQAKNNPTAYEGARVQLARAVGNSSLSRKDIEAAGGDPSIAGKILDTTSVLFTGVPSTDTLRDIARAANIVKKAAQMKKDTLTMQQRDIAEKEFNFTPEQLDRQFPLSPKTTKPTAATAATQQAPIYAVNPATKERRMSTDGGKTWNTVGGQ